MIGCIRDGLDTETDAHSHFVRQPLVEALQTPSYFTWVRLCDDLLTAGEQPVCY